MPTILLYTEAAMKRRRYKNTSTLKDRLTAYSDVLRDRAARLEPGPEQDEIIDKVRQAEVAGAFNEWVSSTGRKPPR